MDSPPPASPAQTEAYQRAFANCLQNPSMARMAADLFADPKGTNAFILDTLPRIQEGAARHPDNVLAIADRLCEGQATRIDSYLGPGSSNPRIAFLCPSRAYRQTFSDADIRLRKRGARVAKLYGEYVDDDYERSEGAFFAGFDIPTRLRNIDLLLTATLVDYRTAPRILFVHDIFDSPLGDESEFRRLASSCAGFFMPSTMGVESLQRVFASIAKPDDPAYGGRRYVIIRGGYSRLDQNIAYFARHAADEKTIIYAPTVVLPEFEPFISVPRWAEAIVETLINRFPDYRIIFRPHPHTLDRPEVQALIARFTPHPRYETSLAGTDYMQAYSRAALMVSDTSGTAYTYAFTTGRPVVFFSPNEAEARARNPGVRYFEFRENIGLIAHDIEGLAAAVASALGNPGRLRSSSFELRDRVVFNVGKSTDYLLSIFDHLIKGTDIPDAIYFRAEPVSGAPV